MLIAIAAALVVGGAAGWLYARPWVWKSRRFRRLIVTLKSGDGFAGVLAKSDRHTLVLRDAEKLGEENVPVDGEVIVQLVDLKYAQRL